MTKAPSLLAVLAFASLACSTWAQPDASPLQAKITVNSAKVIRPIEPRRLGGTNVALWYFPATYDSPEILRGVRELQAAQIRIPGGSWANVVYWNGNGVRGADGTVDTSKVGPDGYPAVDYSGYKPSFLADPKTLYPASGGWHGHVDVKKQQDFIKAIPGTEAMACPNAGTGRPVDAAEWVRWANKKQNYGVRYWEIGNELGGSWEAGTELPFGRGPLTAEMYTARYTAMAKAMRAIDPTIKIGSCPFVEEALRDCGEYVDFVSIHTYPGSTLQSPAKMFADVRGMVQHQVGQVRGWITKHQPQRAKDIEIAYTEWNLSGGIDLASLMSGLWSSIFLGEIATEGVDMAHQWDAFTDLFFGPEENFARKPQYYSLALWNSLMGSELVSVSSSDPSLYTYATKSPSHVTVMVVNTNEEREAKVDLASLGAESGQMIQAATLGRQEYHYSALTKKLQWSVGPRYWTAKTGAKGGLTLPPFSVTYLVLPLPGVASAKPIPKLWKPGAASRKASLQIILPDEVYAGDKVPGEILVKNGEAAPSSLRLREATLTSEEGASLVPSRVALRESVGGFVFSSAAAGEVKVTVQAGALKAEKVIKVKPSVPRPIVFWDFSSPSVTNREAFDSAFSLVEDLTEKANRGIARINLAGDPLKPEDGARILLKVQGFPESEKLNRANIRGVIFEMRRSVDLQCEDPNASVLVVLQGPANWWMKIGEAPLHDAAEWKKVQLEISKEEDIKALPSMGTLCFVIQSSKPVKGSLYFDRIGFLVR